MRRLIATAVCVVALLPPVQAVARPAPKDVDAVWALEGRYWSTVMARDDAAYVDAIAIVWLLAATVRIRAGLATVDDRGQTSTMSTAAQNREISIRASSLALDGHPDRKRNRALRQLTRTVVLGGPYPNAARRGAWGCRKAGGGLASARTASLMALGSPNRWPWP